MKTATINSLFIAGLSILLAACSPDEEAVKPLSTTNQDELVGYNPSGCNLIQSFGDVVKPSMVTSITEDGIAMTVSAQRRGNNGRYVAETAAILLEPSQHPELIAEFDRHILGVYGMLTVPDEAGTGANLSGGRVIIDFTQTGSITMKNMLFTDIDEDEAGSKVELYSSTGQLLMAKDIPLAGDSKGIFVGFNNQPGVSKIIVTFGGERTRNGSGTIARMQMCRDGVGQCVGTCTSSVNTTWLQYVGNRPINVRASISNESSSELLLRSNGMKPGTIFKIEHSSDLINALTIETNRRDVPVFSLACEEGVVSLTENNNMFRMLDARSANSDYLHCMR
ncbi:hypothetical protein [Pontibacter populi]|uniref:Lipoprotein n=1 Tax=Pontibacter populi TaxID=890055 RepID=A0ABV1RUA6_9BACT